MPVKFKRILKIIFCAGGLGVAFFATGPGWVLKCIFSDTRIYLFERKKTHFERKFAELAQCGGLGLHRAEIVLIMRTAY